MCVAENNSPQRSVSVVWRSSLCAVIGCYIYAFILYVLCYNVAMQQFQVCDWILEAFECSTCLIPFLCVDKAGSCVYVDMAGSCV